MKIEFKHIIGILLIATAFQASAQSPVPVKKEPTHKIVFKNKLVTIIYPRVLPGDTTPFHIHETPSIFLVMTNNKVYDETLGKPAETFVSSRGDTWYSDFSRRQTHRIGNLDTAEHLSILIELTNDSKGKFAEPISGLGKPEYFDRVRIYPIKLGSSNTVDIKMTTNPAVMIAYKGNLKITEKGKSVVLKEGDIKWFENASEFTLLNEGDGNVEGYIYEIRK